MLQCLIVKYWNFRFVKVDYSRQETIQLKFSNAGITLLKFSIVGGPFISSSQLRLSLQSAAQPFRLGGHCEWKIPTVFTMSQSGSMYGEQHRESVSNLCDSKNEDSPSLMWLSFGSSLIFERTRESPILTIFKLFSDSGLKFTAHFILTRVNTGV